VSIRNHAHVSVAEYCFGHFGYADERDLWVENSPWAATAVGVWGPGLRMWLEDYAMPLVVLC
jgi:hypothetical protein